MKNAHLTASAIAAAVRVGLAAHVTWTAELIGAQQIYYANHSSHLDFVILWSALPSARRARTRPVASKDYWGNGPIRRFLSARLFNAVLVDRAGFGARRILDPLLQAIDQGSSLILFPEGTRNLGDEILPFKSGIYHLSCLRPLLPLVPVYLGNLNRILPKGEFIPLPALTRVVFGAPLHNRRDESKEDFLARARTALCELKGRPS